MFLMDDMKTVTEARKEIERIDDNNMWKSIGYIAFSVMMCVIGCIWQNIYFTMLMMVGFSIFSCIYVVLYHVGRKLLMDTRLALAVKEDKLMVLTAFFRNRVVQPKEEHLRDAQKRAIEEERYEDAAEIQRRLDEDGESGEDSIPAV